MRSVLLEKLNFSALERAHSIRISILAADCVSSDLVFECKLPCDCHS